MVDYLEVVSSIFTREKAKCRWWLLLEKLLVCIREVLNEYNRHEMSKVILNLHKKPYIFPDLETDLSRYEWNNVEYYGNLLVQN